VGALTFAAAAVVLLEAAAVNQEAGVRSGSGSSSWQRQHQWRQPGTLQRFLRQLLVEAAALA
jgi:hypothetical protein